MLSAFSIFIERPWLAAIPTILFLLLRLRTPKKSITIAALLWLVYLIWEFFIWSGVNCEGACNIRIDLLIIAPVLILSSLFALLQAFRRQS